MLSGSHGTAGRHRRAHLVLPRPGFAQLPRSSVFSVGGWVERSQISCEFPLEEKINRSRAYALALSRLSLPPHMHSQSADSLSSARLGSRMHRSGSHALGGVEASSENVHPGVSSATTPPASWAPPTAGGAQSMGKAETRTRPSPTVQDGTTWASTTVTSSSLPPECWMPTDHAFVENGVFDRLWPIRMAVSAILRAAAS